MKSLIALIRPSHWIKNFLVFAPLIFAQHYNLVSFGRALGIWAAFSLLASAVYVINDMFDRKADSLHPKKKDRPIATGKVSPIQGSFLAFALLIISLTAGYFLHSLPVLLAYAMLNLLYSAYLKQVLILDVMIIAIGFVLRVLVGGTAIGVTVSHWILLCTFFISLFLGLGKRKAEVHVLAENSKGHRRVLEDYTESFLNQLLGTSAAMSILAYSLYAIDPETIRRFGSDHLAYTIPFVVYGIFHYFHLLYNHADGGDPTKVFMRDKPTLLAILGWLLAVIIITHTA